MVDAEKIHDVLTGARMIECNVDLGVMVAWYGGHSLFNVFSLESFEILTAWTESVEDATEAQIAAHRYFKKQTI